MKRYRRLRQSFWQGRRLKIVLTCRSAYTREVSRTASWQLTLYTCAFEAANAFATCPIAGRLELGGVAHTSKCEFPRYHAAAILVEMMVAARRLRRHFCAEGLALGP